MRNNNSKQIKKNKMKQQNTLTHIHIDTQENIESDL